MKLPLADSFCFFLLFLGCVCVWGHFSHENQRFPSRLHSVSMLSWYHGHIPMWHVIVIIIVNIKMINNMRPRLHHTVSFWSGHFHLGLTAAVFWSHRWKARVLSHTVWEALRSNLVMFSGFNLYNTCLLCCGLFLYVLLNASTVPGQWMISVVAVFPYCYLQY